MTIIVGYATDERGGAALNLGVMLARSSGDDLLVACVVPAPWVPGMARIDAEYRSALNDVADGALDQARASIPAEVSARFVRHSARSAPVGEQNGSATRLRSRDSNPDFRDQNPVHA